MTSVARAHLIANTKSGKGQGANLPDAARKIAAELGVDLVHYDTSDGATAFDEQIRRAVESAKADGGTVIAAGGDGTIRSVAQATAEAGVPLGIVSCGTFNFFARNHRIPEVVDEALRLAFTGEIREVRLGKVNEHYFLINASLGLYAKSIIEREKNSRRFWRGRFIVILSTIKSLLSRHRNLDVELVTGSTSKSLATISIFIGNNALQLRDLAMDVARCMKRELLAAVVLKPVSRWDMVRILFRGLSKSLSNEERLEMFCVDSMTIKTRRRHTKVLVALDGEIFPMTFPLRIDAKPRALKMRLPPKLAEPPP